LLSFKRVYPLLKAIHHDGQRFDLRQKVILALRSLDVSDDLLDRFLVDVRDSLRHHRTETDVAVLEPAQVFARDAQPPCGLLLAELLSQPKRF
jgi:hypothetical protein